MIYEGLYLGLQFLWDNLRFEVNHYAKEHFKEQANQAQQAEIDDHSGNTVPQDDEPTETFDDGETRGVADEGDSADM
jgi:hypothetical protein